MSLWLRGLVVLSPLLLLLVVVGCALGGVSREEIPSQAIALVYWEPEDARQRAELLEPVKDAGPTREGVARMEGLGTLLGASDEHQKQWRALKRYPGHLSLLDPRTREITRIEAAPAGARPMAWSSDRKKLLFASSHRGGRSQLYEYRLDTGEIRAVTYGRDAHLYGDYADDGRVGFGVLSEVGTEFRVDLYVTEPGGGSARLVAGGEVAGHMRLSPDGKMVVYARQRGSDSARSGRDRPEELVLLPLELTGGEAGEPRPMGPGRDPTFSPDGQWIVYSAPSQGSWRLRRIRVDGSGRSPLGREGIRDERWPAVSPDGGYVVYVGESEGLDRLFIRRFDGTGDCILLNDGGIAQPIW